MSEKSFTVSKSLAVKYRPKVFKDIVGQKGIVAQLRGCLKRKEVPSTILLYGPPGCGKTTLARMFARYLNCETHDACGECSSCKAFDSDNNPDLIEMNMARATGKADAEALVEKSKYSARYFFRVFVLDEYHQVSSHAENVLLKPMEEPPPGTLWVICTSEPEKLKEATMSRCLKLAVTMTSVDELSAKLVKIAGREGLDLSDKKGVALTKLIANYSNGQVRDAISTLESVILASAGNSKMDLSEVVAEFAATLESSVDKAAARCTVAFLRNSIKGVCNQASTAASCRTLLMKMRWIAVSIIDDWNGNMKFKSYAFKDFLECLKKAEIKYNHVEIVPKMLVLLTLLNGLEVKMNMTSVDERAMFLGDICSYMLTLKKKGESE